MWPAVGSMKGVAFAGGERFQIPWGKEPLSFLGDALEAVNDLGFEAIWRHPLGQIADGGICTFVAPDPVPVVLSGARSLRYPGKVFRANGDRLSLL